MRESSGAALGTRDEDARVLILPLTTCCAGETTKQVLTEKGLSAFVCRTLEQLADEIDRGAAAVVLTDAELDELDLSSLSQALGRQAAWSDLPFIVLAPADHWSTALTGLEPAVHITWLEPSVDTRSLVSVVQTAVRARERQYEVRDLIESERDARHEADRATRAKDRLLAVMSHELRTPLTPIVFAVATLQRDLLASAPAQRALAMISRNLALETKLIDDLLDVSRLVHGRLQLEPTRVDVHDLIRHTVATIEADAREKNLRVEVALDAPVHVLEADAARLHQVVWNVATNAVKFAAPNGLVRLETGSDADGFLLSCSDDGIGIPADALARIFEPFEHGGEDVTRRYGGLGLGLAVSRLLTEAHGGSLTAASDGPDSGATFTLRLPSALFAPEPVEGASGDERAGFAVHPLEILLVEDHLDTSAALFDMLVSNGHRVRLVHTVAAALASAAEGPCDLLISDIGLPDGTGLDVIRGLDPPPSIGAVALSGRGTDEDVARSRAAGFDRHLTKPVNFSVLERTIETIVENKQHPS